MDLKFHSTALFVKDIEISKAFYAEVLQQKIELDFGKNVILQGGITLWEINPLHIIPRLLGVQHLYSPRFQSFELYFETDDFDGICRQLSGQSVELLHPQHEEPWGQRTIRFYDPDRHLVEVGETM